MEQFSKEQLEAMERVWADRESYEKVEINVANLRALIAQALKSAE